MRTYSIPALIALATVTLSSNACAQSKSPVAPVPIISLPCEGCEAVFEGMPAALTSTANIATAGEPGDRMVIKGVVKDPSGRPARGIIVYAYQTDARGIYRPDVSSPGPSGRRHGQLRAWARTESLGRYRFNTIRPAHYPSSTIPEHVHMHIVEPDCCTYYIAEIQFRDDPLLHEKDVKEFEKSGIVTPTRGALNVWQVTHDIVLGDGIPDYPKARVRR